MNAISETHIGMRPYQEDRYVNFKFKKLNVYCIFDGHGGSQVSEFCKSNIENVFKYISNIYGINDINDIIRRVYITLEKAILQLGLSSGSTCLIVIVTDDKVYFSNAGDSMAMVKTKGNNLLSKSYEHKVDDPNEKARIINAGGTITYDTGMARINGINLSRSLGDIHSKKYIIGAPYITSMKKSNVDYIFLASDGIWDVMSNNDVDNILKQKNYRIGKQGLQHLINIAQLNGSTDNITVTFIKVK